MFRRAGAAVKGAKKANGKLSPLGIPHKGLNARDTFASMGADFAISLVNVLTDSYGLRTRKGYTEFANTIPGGTTRTASVLAYYPQTAVEANPPLPPPFAASFMRRMLVRNSTSFPAISGKLFAAKGGSIYDVTAGGVGPWVAQVGITNTSATDYWNGVNFQSVAGSFLLTCNESGGYSYYNGAAWATPTFGGGAGQISGCDPQLFAQVCMYMKRPWFVEKNSTSAWYLPVDSITGAAVEFDFGSQFTKGGHLVALATWPLDSGSGLDDQLVAVGSNGDVVVYQGLDPADPTSFKKKGSYNTGPLPAGRRCVHATGGNVYILTQYGLVPVSDMISDSSIPAMTTLSFDVDPIIGKLMQDFSSYAGWQILDNPREKLILIGMPKEVAGTIGGVYLAYKVTTKTWSVLVDTNYCSMVNFPAATYAGTMDGRVAIAFNGLLDDVPLSGSVAGLAIQCQVTPAYNDLGSPGVNKRVKLVRPTFLTTIAPDIQVTILTDYGGNSVVVIPTTTFLGGSLWHRGRWDSARWGGLQKPLRNWYGAEGWGFAATVQLDYAAAGDTMLTNIDFWTEDGGVL